MLLLVCEVDLLHCATTVSFVKYSLVLLLQKYTGGEAEERGGVGWGGGVSAFSQMKNSLH